MRQKNITASLVFLNLFFVSLRFLVLFINFVFGVMLFILSCGEEEEKSHLNLVPTLKGKEYIHRALSTH